MVLVQHWKRGEGTRGRSAEKGVGAQLREQWWFAWFVVLGWGITHLGPFVVAGLQAFTASGPTVAPCLGNSYFRLRFVFLTR